ncbi:MAG: glutamine--fructose-6-phosphate transaminase (isomerizing) [Chlamydiia bacterium]|nr:glutamine--fructose-6-phosphate transaminase (isomerizing) [Chlamydiia bacterium]
MCGVFGYVGARDPLQVCLTGLSALEYRGYDSTGIAGISQGKISFCKKAGKLSELKKVLSFPPLELAIAHTRWATHGKVNDQNAHPHFDASHSIAVIHNGIIENFSALREELLREKALLASETDTEIVAHLIAKYYKGDLVRALHSAMQRLKGAFSLLVIHKDHPGELVATARDCPLSVALDAVRTEGIVSSDPNVFFGTNFDVIFLKASEIACVRKGSVDVVDSELRKITKKSERIAGSFTVPSKEGFEHYMLKEIYEQPITIQKAFLGRYARGVSFEELSLQDAVFRNTSKICIIGCGTSSHAGSIGALFLEEFAGVFTSCEIASEARYRPLLLSPDTLVIAISQSGETADTLAALHEAKKRGCTTLGLCNVKNSALVREADGALLLQAGPEMSVCSTKAFTSQLTTLFLFSLFMGQIKKTLTQERLLLLQEELKTIPAQIEQVINRAPEIQRLAKKYARHENFFFMGRRYMFPTCLEAALKLKEISYVNANGYPAGELKHGPIALLDAHFPVIAFCANRQTEEKILSNVMEVKARGAPVLAIASDHFKQIQKAADDVFYIPDSSDSLAPFASTVVGQLFAYYIAKERGCEIDQPRNLAKSVTVE